MLGFWSVLRAPIVNTMPVETRGLGCPRAGSELPEPGSELLLVVTILLKTHA